MGFAIRHGKTFTISGDMRLPRHCGFTDHCHEYVEYIDTKRKKHKLKQYKSKYGYYVIIKNRRYYIR